MRRLKKQIESYEPLFNKAIQILSRGNRSIAATQDKLSEYCLNVDLIQKVILRLRELNYLNDERYAESLVESKVRYGKSRLRNILLQKKIPKDIADMACDGLEERDVETIRHIAEKKWDSLSKRGDREKNKDKLFRFLVSRGFSFELAMKQVKLLSNDLSRQNDFEE